MKKSRPPKAIRERSKTRCRYCRKELFDAMEIMDGVCYFCSKNPKRRTRFILSNSEKDKLKNKNGKRTK